MCEQVNVYGFRLPHATSSRHSRGRGSGYGKEASCEGRILYGNSARGKAFRSPSYVLQNVIGPGSQFVARIREALTSGLMLTIDGGQANAGLVYVDDLDSVV